MDLLVWYCFHAAAPRMLRLKIAFHAASSAQHLLATSSYISQKPILSAGCPISIPGPQYIQFHGKASACCNRPGYASDLPLKVSSSRLTPSQDVRIQGNDPLYSPSSCFYGDGSAKNVLAKEATPRRQLSSVFINRTIEAAGPFAFRLDASSL